jgi:hypothetical protein
MLEVLTGTGLAVAAGLNAYIPLLLVGLAGRFLDAVVLPDAWAWLATDWVLGGLAVLLVIELVADKVPVVDTINDVLQSIVRPAAGGIVFGSGSAAQTFAVTEPGEPLASQQWVPIVVGAVIALLVHLAKMAARPAANALTAGAAAPALSLAEDLGALLLSALALVLPLLVVVVLIGFALALPLLLARARRRRLSVDRA